MSEMGIRPNYAYDILRGRNYCHPFTMSKRFDMEWGLNVPITFDLFQTENGYETVIDKFVVMWDMGLWGQVNLFRAGLRANGRLMDGFRDGCFVEGEPNYEAKDILRSNGFVPANFLNGINDFNFLYRAKTTQQISCVIEQFVPSAEILTQGGVILVAGAQLAA